MGILEGEIKMSYVYCYTNKITGRKYVGQTNNIDRRKREHLSNANNPNSKEYDYLFHKKLRQYGEENFIFSILEETSPEKIDEAEQFWIKELHTSVQENGYNLTLGGDTLPKQSLYKEHIPEIKEMIKKGMPFDVISQKFGISIPHLSAINHGKYYREENEQYPLYRYYNNKEEVQYIKNLLQNTDIPMTEIAKQTGMSYSTIKKINSGSLQYEKSKQYPLRKKNSGLVRAELIQKMLLEGESNQEIICKTKVSETTIGRINRGESYYNSSLSYPLRSL